jgi:hypothetical protein
MMGEETAEEGPADCGGCCCDVEDEAVKDVVVRAVLG